MVNKRFVLMMGQLGGKENLTLKFTTSNIWKMLIWNFTL